MFQMRLLFCVPCYIGRGSGGCPPPQGRGRRRWISFSGDPSWSSRSSSSWSPQQSWRGFQVAVSAPAIVAKAGVFNFIIAQTFNLNLHFHIRTVNTSVQASELRRLENVVLLCCNVEEIWLGQMARRSHGSRHWETLGWRQNVSPKNINNWIIVHRLLVSRGEKLFRFLDMNVRLWGGEYLLSNSGPPAHPTYICLLLLFLSLNFMVKVFGFPQLFNKQFNWRRRVAHWLKTYFKVLFSSPTTLFTFCLITVIISDSLQNVRSIVRLRGGGQQTTEAWWGAERRRPAGEIAVVTAT